MSDDIPGILRILAIDGMDVLLDKGRWHGISGDEEEPLIVVRGGSARPSIADGGLEYRRDDFLGTVEITEIAEPLSMALYTRDGISISSASATMSSGFPFRKRRERAVRRIRPSGPGSCPYPESVVPVGYNTARPSLTRSPTNSYI